MVQLITSCTIVRNLRFIIFQLSNRMEAKQALEVEYTPSLFSRRFKTSGELMGNFVTFATNGKHFTIKLLPNLS